MTLTQSGQRRLTLLSTIAKLVQAESTIVTLVKATAMGVPMYGPGWPLTPPNATSTPSADGMTQKGTPECVLYLSPAPAPAPAGP